MNSLITLCIFVAILFLYIHIANQFKKTYELEIYESDFSNKNHFEDVCELKQPVLFNMKNILPNLFEILIPENIAQFSNHDIYVKDTKDYFDNESSSIDQIYLPLHTSIKFMESDIKGHLFSENNQEFLDESGLLKKIEPVNNILKPNFTINQHFDLLFGSCNTVLPFRYHTSNRQFLCVTNGKIKVKMTSWKSSKFMHPYKDFENYEFRSLINPKEPQSDFMCDYEKINFIEFYVEAGYMLYIPPYWWYSINYLEDPTTFACNITYNTFINCVSNIWDLSIYFLQQQNITKRVKHSNEIQVENKETESDVEENIEENDKIIESEVSEPEDIIANPIEKEVIKESDEKPETVINDEKPTTTIIKPIKKKENINYTISDI